MKRMNLQEAIQFVIDSIDKSDREDLISDLNDGATPHRLSVELHHSLGTWVRNGLGLWQDDSESLRGEIWDAISPEDKRSIDEYWKSLDYPGRIGHKMHADDASGHLIEMALKKMHDESMPKKRETNLSVHLSHCNFGEHVGSCKYGAVNCPALTDEWSWFGIIVQENSKLRDRIQVLEEQLATLEGKHLFDDDGFCYKCGQWKFDFALLSDTCIVREK